MHCQIELVHWVHLVLKFMGRLKVCSTANPVNKVSQTFQIPTLSGTTYRIRARLWAADSWNTNEHVYVHVQDPDNPSLEPAPQVVAEGYNCVWNRPPATSDVEPASASINKWQKYADSIFNPYEQIVWVEPKKLLSIYSTMLCRRRVQLLQHCKETQDKLWIQY